MSDEEATRAPRGADEVRARQLANLVPGGKPGTVPVPRVLRNMRLVDRGREPAGGWTGPQLKLKGMFDEQYEKFLDKLLRAEREFAAIRGRGGSAPAAVAGAVKGPEGPDLGSERALALCRSVLKELAEKAEAGG